MFGCIEDVLIATIEICKVIAEFYFKVVLSTKHWALAFVKQEKH